VRVGVGVGGRAPGRREGISLNLPSASFVLLALDVDQRQIGEGRWHPYSTRGGGDAPLSMSHKWGWQVYSPRKCFISPLMRHNG